MIYQPVRLSQIGLLAMALASCSLPSTSTKIDETPIPPSTPEITVGVDTPQVHAVSVDQIDPGVFYCKKTYTDIQSDDSVKVTPFWSTQFPEVVLIHNNTYPHGMLTPNAQSCTGTAISDQWIITAAHCILGRDVPTGKFSDGPNDFVDDSVGQNDFDVDAGQAVILPIVERYRSVRKIVVHSHYRGSKDRYLNDIALLRLDRPYPASAVPPAQIAFPGRFEKEVSILGYGYADAKGGSQDHLLIVWPSPLTQDEKSEQLVFDTNGNGGICSGDSGGPAFAGRLMGCKVGDPITEAHPHILEGISSWNMPGSKVPEFNTVPRNVFDRATIRACVNSRQGGLQDLTDRSSLRRDWICHTTSDEAVGCQKAGLSNHATSHPP